MGPLAGITVVHIASLGPGPCATMLLGDLGATVIVVDRVSGGSPPSSPPEIDPRRRGQRSIRVNLKHPQAEPVVGALVEHADVLIEGMRPGVAERLGVGPDACFERNPRLVYARMTGWGQYGPLAQSAGHDLNYIALTGALHALGDGDRPPPPPLNLLGDYAGGGTYLALGIVAALVRRGESQVGEVIDGSIVDGVASLTAASFGMIGAGTWRDRGENLFDGGAPFYRTYETRDGRYVAVGAIEPEFYAEMMRRVGLDPTAWPQEDRRRWPELAEELAGRFRTRTRSEWTVTFEGSDACVSPVLTFVEAPEHPHNAVRGTYVNVDGVLQPAPAPRFAKAPLAPPGRSPSPGQHTDAVLRELGFTDDERKRLEIDGVVGHSVEAASD